MDSIRSFAGTPGEGASLLGGGERRSSDSRLSYHVRAGRVKRGCSCHAGLMGQVGGSQSRANGPSKRRAQGFQRIGTVGGVDAGSNAPLAPVDPHAKQTLLCFSPKQSLSLRVDWKSAADSAWNAERGSRVRRCVPCVSEHDRDSRASGGIKGSPSLREVLDVAASCRFPSAETGERHRGRSGSRKTRQQKAEQCRIRGG